MTPMTDPARPEQLHRAEKPLLLSQMRIDGRRDTSILVQRNVSGHVHITLGRSEVTMILHPHMAKRLCADITAVLEGANHAFD